ncbi:hypothetical protein ASC64_09960 [Nocardioides sp. Root122]|uniref:hypothetical protein n=1 Tax=Nocardioides TaxID=1839 RepID=UPI000702DFDC|nr:MULTISPECIES: hypothetical protein [Nocardioides]KQV67561.1 hypothetical protein ASC64_09960 [Nocardioides sp. Root122]MCK9824930.1 hypothetical protein [Nocardioides cavernae]
MSENSESQTDNPESTDTPKAASGTSPADADHSGGTASPDDATLGGISDDQLPEDLQPGEDNPLAEPLDPDDEATKDQDELEMDATQEDLGKPPVQSSGESDDQSEESDEPDANSGEGAQGAGITGG